MPQILNLSKIYTPEQLEEALNPKIKPCPHCGGTGVLKYNYSARLNKYFVFVKCEQCSAQGRAGCCDESPEENNYTDRGCDFARHWWNLRTNE